MRSRFPMLATTGFALGVAAACLLDSGHLVVERPPAESAPLPSEAIVAAGAKCLPVPLALQIEAEPPEQPASPDTEPPASPRRLDAKRTTDVQSELDALYIEAR